MSGVSDSTTGSLIARLAVIVIKRLRGGKRIPFAICGAEGTGKTTFCDRLASLPVNGQHSPTYGYERRKPVRPKELEDVIILPLDCGGQERWWRTWEEAFIKRKPTVLVFMVDDDERKPHAEALDFMLNFVTKRDRRFWFLKGPRTRVREQLEGVLFLANKADLWRKTRDYQEILLSCAEQLGRLKKLVSSLGLFYRDYAISSYNYSDITMVIQGFFAKL